MSTHSGRIIYLDGFAGPGIYSGGEDGSPVIALETAVNHFLAQKLTKTEILFFFIEQDKARAQKLKDVLAKRFPKLPPNIKYIVEGAEFAPTFKQTLDTLDQQGGKLAPTFAFIDPFGFSGMPMELIARLLNCKKCEVLITFMASFVRRFNDDARENALNELYATEEWKKLREIVDPDERLKLVVKLYESQLIKLGGADYVKSFGMIGPGNQIIYYLVFATKHLKGLEVMKDAMWSVDPTGSYKFSDVTGFNQSLLMDFQSEPLWVEGAAKLVYNKFKGKTVNERIIRRFVVAETQYRYRKTILQSLEKSDPPLITEVFPRQRVFTHPDGCSITFAP